MNLWIIGAIIVGVLMLSAVAAFNLTDATTT